MTINFKRLLSTVLCVVLLAAVALTTIGCSDKKTDGKTDETTVMQQVEEKPKEEAKTVGEGQTQFDFVVIDKEGKETKFVVKTDKTTVGQALLDAKLIEGEDGQFGLYVKTVNGITADYDIDQTYWAFLVDGEMSMIGVDQTNIEQGKTYTFKVSK